MSKRKIKWQRILSTALMFALVASCFSAPVVVRADVIDEKPLTNYTKSWIGNDYPGIGENGYGEWVQNAVLNADFVNGTIVTCSLWDEAGRCSGLFRDGKINKQTIQTSPARSPWGWGTASSAVAANETDFWLFNDASDLLHYTWDYQDLESHRYVGYAESPADTKVVSMTEKDGILYALRESGDVEVWDGQALTKIRDFTIAGAKRLVINPETDEIWAIVGTTIKNYDTKGKALGRTIKDAGEPSNLSIDEQNGHLVVCDNGTRQQVLFYDISGTGTPKFVKAIGEKGGITAGKPGEYTTDKLFNIVAAGTDEAGNIYVTMSYNNLSCIIRAYKADGTFDWERKSFHFTDCATFMPGTDGTEIYSTDEIFAVDYSKSYGKEATVKSITYDVLQDPEISGSTRSNVWAVVLEGKRVLYMNGMYSNTRKEATGFDMYVFEEEDSDIATYVGTFTDIGSGLDVDNNGTIWTWKDGRIVANHFGGFDDKNCPTYPLSKVETYSVPAEFTQIERVLFDDENQILYISGYNEEYPANDWGRIGLYVEAYDWNDGKPTLRFEMPWPSEDEGSGLTCPKAFEVAGDYIFAATCRSARVHVLSNVDGEYIGTMQTQPEIGESGWIDIPYGIRATKRENGDYVVLVEEDFRAKNVLYRWNPNGLAEPGEPVDIPVENPEETEPGSDEIKVLYNGKKVVFDVLPMIINDRTMVPVRAVFEALGATVDWDAETQTVISEKDGHKVTIQINAPTMFVNGEEKAIDVPAQIVDDRTLVPLRAISEAYGCEVAWDGDTRTVTIKGADAVGSYYGSEMKDLTGYSNIENLKIRGLEKGSTGTLKGVVCDGYTAVTIESATNMGRDLHIQVYLDDTKGAPIAEVTAMAPDEIKDGHRLWTLTFNEAITGTHDVIFVAHTPDAFNEDFEKFTFSK